MSVDNLLLTLNIRNDATYNVYADKMQIEVVEDYKIPFSFALHADRWTSFSLPKKYFELIHSDIIPSVIEEMFAVEKPIFQYKKGVIGVNDNELSDFLRELGETESNRLVENYRFVNKQDVPAIASFGIPVINHNTVTVNDNNYVKMDNAFSYSIKNYTYDSFKSRF